MRCSCNTVWNSKIWYHSKGLKRKIYRIQCGYSHGRISQSHSDSNRPSDINMNESQSHNDDWKRWNSVLDLEYYAIFQLRNSQNGIMWLWMPMCLTWRTYIKYQNECDYGSRIQILLEIKHRRGKERFMSEWIILMYF